MRNLFKQKGPTLLFLKDSLMTSAEMYLNIMTTLYTQGISAAIKGKIGYSCKNFKPITDGYNCSEYNQRA